MSSIDPSLVENRMLAIQASYQRQLSLVGKPGYDPQLTVQLKKDLDWMANQKQMLSSDHASGNSSL